MLAVIGSMGATTLAGCSGGSSGDESDGNATTTTGGDGSGGGGSDGSDATTTAEESDVGMPIWGQRKANAAGTGAVDAQAITTGNPSSYSVSLPVNRDVEYHPFYDPVFTGNALIHRGEIRDKSTGETVRELPATETATPALRDGRLYMVAGADVIAVDIESNEELWRETTGKNGIGIVATSDHVFIALGDGITALSASDGSREWNVSTGALNDKERGIFAVADGRLYASTPRQRGTTVHDISDGTQLWSVDGRGVSQLGPQGTLYFNEGGAVDSGTVTRFDSEGSQMWETRPSGSTSPVAAEEDRVYLSDNDSPMVTTVSAEDGSEQWTTELPQGIADLAVGSDRVYALGSGRDDTTRLFALNKQSGEQENIYALDSDASTPRGAGGVTVGGGVVSLMRSNINSNRMQVLTDN
ncbi:PQQ-binding-like beta-propeller repeat protein [Halorientalis pallida]|uniref:outer membrane protein assembly factor BamB family protein n=1 Tax=Halorientalis pallida TaxID=2479928 RepID=UPI003C6FDA06